MVFREFLVQRYASKLIETYAVRIEAYPDRYIGTVALLGAGGTRVPVRILNEPVLAVPADYFFRYRTRCRRHLAVNLKAAILEGRTHTLADGEQYSLSLAANLEGFGQTVLICTES